MNKGKIIFLNGVTSSGKTSIARTLQKQESGVFFYALSNDMFEECVGYDYLVKDYWKHLGDAIFIMYGTAKSLSDAGHNVIIDGMLFEPKEIPMHYKRLTELMKDNPLFIVEVSCPLEICRQRNIARGDRGEFQSHEQHEMMAKNVEYSLTVQSDLYTANRCAEQILNAFFPSR